MIFYWAILAFKKFLWFFKIPNVNQFAYVDVNAKCPICGHRTGRLRCVIFAKTDGKPGPQPVPPKNIPQEGQILCQHICNICGARWHDEPWRSIKSTEYVLPSVARTRREIREDHWSVLRTNKPDGQTAAST